MKQKLIILSAVMGLLIFSSCQKDDFGVERGNTNESILIVRKKFSDFKKLPSLAEKALSRSNVLDRGNSTDPLYDFQIDSTSVTQAQKDGHTYYTMAIFRPISTEESFENLVVSDDAQQAYIFKYYPSEDYLQKKMWMQHPQYSGSVNITEIDYNELSSRGNCVSITLFFCGNGPPGTPAGDCCYASAEDDGAGDGGAHVTTRTYEVCSDEDLYITQIVTDPSPGSSNGGGGGAGGGGGGTQTPGSYPVSPVKPTPADPNSPLDPLTDPNENPVLTEPLIILVRPQTPCKQLKNLLKIDVVNPTSEPNIKPRLQELIVNAQAPINYETGFKFIKSPEEEFSSQQLQAANNSHNTVSVRVGESVYGSSHTHTYKLYPMFSWDDVYVLFNIYFYGQDHVKNDAVTFLVTKECLTCAGVKVYALKIEDWNKFRYKIQTDLNNPDTVNMSEQEKIENVNKKFAKKFINQTNYEQMFLQNFANSGISLYKANSELTDWAKLELSGSPLSPVSEIPCN